MFPHDRESRHRALGQPPGGGDASIGARIARARRDAGLTQRALADLVGVRLWVVDRWESGARPVAEEQLNQVAKATHRTVQWLETGVGERASAEVAPEATDVDAPTEESHPELDERLAEVARREREVREKEHELQQAVGETDEPQAVPESAPGELAETEAAQEHEPPEAVAAPADEQPRHDEGPADAEREAAARTELDVQQALVQAEELRGELERERAKVAAIEEARRLDEFALAKVAERERIVTERERVVAEREARFEARALGDGGDTSHFDALARWLTDSVKAAAKREADAIVKAAREQARQILAEAKAEREPPGEGPPAS